MFQKIKNYFNYITSTLKNALKDRSKKYFVGDNEVSQKIVNRLKEKLHHEADGNKPSNPTIPHEGFVMLKPNASCDFYYVLQVTDGSNPIYTLKSEDTHKVFTVDEAGFKLLFH